MLGIFWFTRAMAWERGDEVKIIRQFEEQEEFIRPSSVFK